MGEVPGWMREQLRVEGWVVLESMETFDVHMGQWYPNRTEALHKALAGDALLSSRGKAATSGDLEEFLLGRLHRSAEPIRPEDKVGALLYWVDSVERHRRPKKAPRARPETAPGTRETRPWTCPNCKKTWPVLAEEPDVPEERARCPDCGEPPSQFTPGQIVRVRNRIGPGPRLGLVHEPVKAGCFKPDEPNVVHDVGPYTGEYMVLHLSEGYGSEAPVTPEAERAVFAGLHPDPALRLALGLQMMTGISAPPSRIQALSPEDLKQLSASR